MDQLAYIPQVAETEEEEMHHSMPQCESCWIWHAADRSGSISWDTYSMSHLTSVDYANVHFSVSHWNTQGPLSVVNELCIP